VRPGDPLHKAAARLILGMQLKGVGVHSGNTQRALRQAG
jgi:hypothetical protein